jgi:hypothetical protein
MKNLVFILDTDDDVEPVCVEDQERYFEEWLESLGP